MEKLLLFTEIQRETAKANPLCSALDCAAELQQNPEPVWVMCGQFQLIFYPIYRHSTRKYIHVGVDSLTVPWKR